MAYKFGEAFIDLTGKNVGLDKMLGRVRKSFGSLKVHLKRLAIVGIGAFTLGLGYATKQAMDAEEAVSKLKNILRATGHAVGYTYDQLSKYAVAMMKVTKFNDDLIKEGAAIMATFTRVRKEVFIKGMEAAMDMATVFKQELTASIIQLGTALNDPIRGIGRLRRIGISFTESQKDAIKNFIKQNKLMEAQKVILDELQVEIGGAARAAANTTKGALVQMKNAFDEIAESIGNAVLPGLRDMAVKTKTWMQENEAVVVSWGKKTLAVVEMIKDGFFILVGGLRENWKEALGGVSKAFIEFTIGLIRVARVAGSAIGENQGKSFLGKIMKYLAKSGYAYQKLAVYLSQLWMSEKTYQSSMKYWDDQEKKAVSFWQGYSDSATTSLSAVRTELEAISTEVKKKMRDALPTNMVDKFTASWDKLLKKLKRIGYEAEHMEWIEFLGKATSELNKWVRREEIAKEEWGRKPFVSKGAVSAAEKGKTTFQPAALVGLKEAWNMMARQTAGVMKEMEIQQAQLTALQGIHTSIQSGIQADKQNTENVRETIRQESKNKIGVVGP
ncbi:MAG: phage tail length tape measure family protein [Candidatus Heimdallarchaeota archaeon]